MLNPNIYFLRTIFAPVVFFFAAMPGVAAAESIYASEVVEAVGGENYDGELKPVLSEAWYYSYDSMEIPDDGKHALGPPDYDDRSSFDTGASGWGNWTGHMILKFDTPLKDLQGDDLTAYYWGQGSTDINTSETMVYASSNAIDWLALGEMDKSESRETITTSWDFAECGVNDVSFVKIEKKGIYETDCDLFIDAVEGHYPERGPVLCWPTDGLTGVSLTPELQTEAFYDPDSGEIHTKTQWQISTDPDFSSVVIDTTSTSYLTSFIVPDFLFDSGTTYHWRVKFTDNHNVESLWSEPFSFETAVPPVEDTTVYASYVVEAVGGTKYNGTEMPVVKDQKGVWPMYEADNGEHALGPPDYETLDDSGNGGFASGWSNWGGYMILGFDFPVRDLEGIDLVFYHWGPGARDLDYSTSFVYASENGTDWTQLGELDQSGRGVITTTGYDFANFDGVDGVSYVKVVKNYNGTDKKKCGKYIDAVAGNPPYMPGADRNKNGIPDEQEVDDTVDLDNDGTPDINQYDIKCVNTVVGDQQIGVNISTNVTAIESIRSLDPAIITDADNRPEDVPSGLILFKLKVANEGDEAEAFVYLSEPAPADAKWYTYDSINGWQDYSDLGYATFSEDRKCVTLKLKDGGYGDIDLSENGLIIDLGGFGIQEVADDIYVIYGTDTDTSDEGGCFIATASR
jgi:hypothetical protein